MSEYWKSTPKYWCKHCSTYVKDTPFERRQHENTAKHQNNLKRFLRDIQNNHERGEREKERAKSEVERLKGFTGGEPSKISSLSNPPSRQTLSNTQKPTKTPQSEADRKRQWSQLAEMGIKVPEEFRAEMAMAGDWQKLSQRDVNELPAEAPLSTGIKKRKYEGQEEDEEEKESAGEVVLRRGWGATTKSYPGHDSLDLDDLLSGSISVKKENQSSPKSQIKNEESVSSEQGKALALEEDESASRNSTKVEDFSDSNAIKARLVKEESESPRTSTPTNQPPGEVSFPVFKKRKAKVS